ncbi:MAG: DUF2304 domain-containing protein [Patescibacteria group bacterium]
MLIQYILIIAIILIELQTIRKFRSNIVSRREFLFWSSLWVAIGVVVLLPQITVFLANYLGVGRGADLVVYASLIFVFYMIFRIFARQERMEKNISKIIEEIAKKGK